MTYVYEHPDKLIYYSVQEKTTESGTQQWCTVLTVDTIGPRVHLVPKIEIASLSYQLTERIDRYLNLWGQGSGVKFLCSY